ncbi:hypothetical protein GLOTRDRAFT_93461 [Gloeophyllum trabeum ATCC 11539]|uniref:Uncharacterized protein n=1 Tax=Gloeophyllum trabeum (strain ATCC 11539 / FP-39264 / Madison 617) TaxID=670483 RepID=S7Q8U5_GLOTA|nr:uncharacterized protein GLOTRDRAFT_93461 [Gloeophyllum trabeum ATCC 11539]EPQ55947.1 hypothetical protein GLOTRDRAFT_93461 [Gloeophyllum trabeum ATCC 11539]
MLMLLYSGEGLGYFMLLSMDCNSVVKPQHNGSGTLFVRWTVYHSDTLRTDKALSRRLSNLASERSGRPRQPGGTAFAERRRLQQCPFRTLCVWEAEGRQSEGFDFVGGISHLTPSCSYNALNYEIRRRHALAPERLDRMPNGEWQTRPRDMERASPLGVEDSCKFHRGEQTLRKAWSFHDDGVNVCRCTRYERIRAARAGRGQSEASETKARSGEQHYTAVVELPSFRSELVNMASTRITRAASNLRTLPSRRDTARRFPDRKFSAREAARAGAAVTAVCRDRSVSALTVLPVMPSYALREHSVVSSAVGRGLPSPQRTSNTALCACLAWMTTTGNESVYKGDCLLQRAAPLADTQAANATYPTALAHDAVRLLAWSQRRCFAGTAVHGPVMTAITTYSLVCNPEVTLEAARLSAGRERSPVRSLKVMGDTAPGQVAVFEHSRGSGGGAGWVVAGCSKSCRKAEKESGRWTGRANAEPVPVHDRTSHPRAGDGTSGRAAGGNKVVLVRQGLL